jgi:hypothetical protein
VLWSPVVPADELVHAPVWSWRGAAVEPIA